MSEQTTIIDESVINLGEPQPKTVKRGCWKFVAIGCACVFLVAAIGGFFAYRGIRGFISGVTEKYTFAAPMELPTVDMPEDEAAAVLDRVGAFTEALKQNAAPSPLILTSREINLLINRHPNWKEMAGKVYVTIEEDRIKGQTSIPLDELGSLFEGRHLNGSAVFRIDMAAGRLLLFLDSVEVGGEPIPEEFMSAMRAKNLAEEANKEPNVIAVLEKLESITVRDGSLIIVPKPL